EERFPEPALLPADLEERARVRLRIERFDHSLGNAYYAFRRRDDDGEEHLSHCLSFIERRFADPARPYDLADIAYLPWLIRLRDRRRVDGRGLRGRDGAAGPRADPGDRSFRCARGPGRARAPASSRGDDREAARAGLRRRLGRGGAAPALGGPDRNRRGPPR